MYAVEEEIRDKKLTGEAKQIHRLMYSKPLVEYFFDWVDRELARQGFTPSNPYIQALNYVRERRSGLEVFLTDPDVPIDTNHIERALRVIPMGRNYPRFVIMDGRRATIAHNRYLYASAGSRLHRFAFHNCRCFLLDVQPSRGEFPWFGTHVSGRDSNPAKSGLRLHRSKIQALRTLSILPSAAMRPARSRAILEALLTLFIGLLSEGFAPGTFASR
jgi:Transposase IS66 family